MNSSFASSSGKPARIKAPNTEPGSGAISFVLIPAFIVVYANPRKKRNDRTSEAMPNTTGVIAYDFPISSGTSLRIILL